MSSRREFLGGVLAAASLRLHAKSASARPGPTFKAACFDAFTIFDPRSLNDALEREVPGKGTELATAWRTKLFDYCWLRTLYGRYVNFDQVAAESLDVVLETTKTSLSEVARIRVQSVWRELKPWPDSADALRAMRARGTRLAYLSNFTAAILDANSDRLGVRQLFEFLLTTDAVQAYKPHPRAYAMGESSFGISRADILFVAFGGWDAAGARAFGFPTVWVNRFGAAPERLGIEPNGIVSTLQELASSLNS